jgi:hypothetical protein
MNEMAYVLQAWLPLIVWQQVDAPRYHKGYITVSCFAVMLIIMAFTVRFLWKRELLRYAACTPRRPGETMLMTNRKRISAESDSEGSAVAGPSEVE